jgi:subtilisin
VLDNLCEQTGAGDAWDVASFSTKGDYVDIAAPGASLTSGTPQGGTFSDFAGTSFASPQVAGALALLRQVSPDANSQTIAQSLLEQATPLLADRDEVGAGQLNVTLEP